MSFYHLNNLRILSYPRKLSNKYNKNKNTGLDAVKTASKNVVHIAAEVTGEFLGNKIGAWIVQKT